MSRLAVHIEQGELRSIETDDASLDGMEVAILVDNQPTRLMRPVFESAVHDYVEAVRSPELQHCLVQVCETISQTFAELSTNRQLNGEAMLSEVESKLGQARDALEVAKRQAGWRGRDGRPVLRALVAK